MDTNNILFCKDLNTGAITSINGVDNSTVFMNPRFLSGLADVNISNPILRQQLMYNSTSQKWENQFLYLNTLPDVNITGTPTNNEYLKWDTTTSKWINRALQYCIVNNFGKIKDSLFSSTMSYKSLLATSTFDSQNITIDNFGGLTVDNTDGSISGFRTSTNYNIEINLTLNNTGTFSQPTNSSIGFVKNAVGAPALAQTLGITSTMKQLVLSVAGVYGSFLVNDKLYPVFGMNSVYTGLLPNDFSMTILITEL